MADDEADVNDAQRIITGELIMTGPHTFEDRVADAVYEKLRDAKFTPDQASIFADTFEAYRQQGRDEVLREIANVFPNEFSVQATNDEGRCVFCLSYPTHTTNCLWVRCQGVK